MELTQKGEMVSRLQAKAGQIGKILNNLEKYNHLLKDDKKVLDRRMSEKKLQLQQHQQQSSAKFLNNKENIPKNEIASISETSTCPESVETTTREPILSESTESFVKLDLEETKTE